jgi:hypothetical protein
VKGELLLMILTLLPNQFDHIQLFKPALRDGYERCIKGQAVRYRRKTVGRRFWEFGARCILGCKFVPEL